MNKKEEEKKAQELQQKLGIYQLYHAQIEELKKQAEMLQSRAMEIEASRVAVEDLRKAKKGSEMMVPVGSGIYANGSFSGGDMFMDLGAGVLAKRPPEEAAEKLGKGMEEVENMAAALQNEMVSLAEKANSIAQELQKELGK